MLEMVGIPYVGSGPLAHSLALDKVVAKMIFRQNGLLTPDFAVLDAPGFEMPELGFPLIVKPKNEAVSFGIKIVNDEKELREAAGAIFSRFQQPVLAEQYYRPYHDRLRDLASGDVELGIDCHTMAAAGPPVGPDAGRKRPHLCLSNADGTLPPAWLADFAGCLASAFGFQPSINDPFMGGFIVRSHSAEIPWVQLEVSRGPFLPIAEKRKRFLEALRCFCSLR
jgi:hypothetical protein